MSTLKQRWDAACEEVAEACRNAGRDPKEVKVIAVSKTVGPEVVGEAIEAGVVDFGENRTVPFNEKHDLYPDANWHLIGQLQSRKAKDVVGKACLIHSLDRESLLLAIQKAAAAAGVVQDVLVEVSVSGEESKGGIAPEELHGFLQLLSQQENVRCLGLMTMAPRGDAGVATETFAGLRKLSQEMAEAFQGSDKVIMQELSMGMSEDFPYAVAEGATMVRIGRRIFDPAFQL